MDFERKRQSVFSCSIALLVLSGLSIIFAITHLARYEGMHYWRLYDFYGRYTGDGLWGCILGVIGSCLGIAAGKSSDYPAFRSLYIAQSFFVSVFQSMKHIRYTVYVL